MTKLGERIDKEGGLDCRTVERLLAVREAARRMQALRLVWHLEGLNHGQTPVSGCPTCDLFTALTACDADPLLASMANTGE